MRKMLNLEVLPKAREKLERAKEKVRSRGVMGQANPAGTEGPAQGQIQIGGGGLISRGRNIAQRGKTKAQELRPNVLPRVTERLERAKPLQKTREELLGKRKRAAGVGPAKTEGSGAGSPNPAGVGE